MYNYDLISGKVNSVAYQPNQPDAFYHRYSYDAENRLILVETSSDNMLWEKDARYSYYKHGPLAKTIIGDNQVQGIDYAYTLQGWLKGINATSVGNGQYDIGNDGLANGHFSLIGRDAYGFSLNYYNNDYKPINNAVNPFAPVVMPLPVNPSNTLEGTGKELFNGNIAAMAVNIPKIGRPNVYGYRYDQLNRLITMDLFNGLDNNNNTFSSPVRSDEYHEKISYDANGNILTYLRNADANRLSMDNMIYSYKPNTNQLDKVVDVAPDASAVDYNKYNDIKQGQQNGNYQYDAIGNLIADVSEGISNINWNVYGKIQEINKNGTLIKYTYDASGNRISKTFNGKTTWYVRDASGNVMSVYTVDATVNSGHLTQSEVNLYGSNRLGIWNANKDIAVTTDANYLRGSKSYELSNHLGNVLVTITDKKLQHTSNNSTIDYYEADVSTANDYYLGGMEMGERKYSSLSQYRFGFGGHEKDNEVSGEGNHLAFGDYGLDTRLGRRWNIEPHIKKYPFNSSYLVFANNPILYADPDGKDIIVLRNSAGANGTGHGAILVGDNKNGWTYISKDGFTGSAFGSQSKFVAMKFSSIEEFRNSPHNFETVETHSTTDGKQTTNLTFKLDKEGNKIQRYDQALYIPTTQSDGSSTDKKTINAATNSAKSEYCLMNGDCSDVVTDGLNASKDNNGKQIKNGESNTFQTIMEYPFNEMPNAKYNRIESRNKSGVKYDAGVNPDSNKLQSGEKGKKK